MPKTYNDLYLATRTALKNAGVEAYALEARLLVAYAVGKTKEEFVRDLRLYTSDENEQKIEALLQRRIAGEPLAYLIGEWEFHGLPIVVTPDVLIPRMDTEVLVDAALRVLVGRKMNARILDLCSGSGCIGCALAHELPAARVVMVDISDEALTVSKENLRRNHQNRTICLKADALEKPPMGIGTFDLIVSNPPYVASMDILTLDSSVRDYEPLGALDVVVVDSVAALLPRSELEGEMGESSVGVIARLMSQALRKLAGTVSRTNCIVVFINQLREKIGVMYGNPETTPGGRALKYFSSVRIDVRRIETLKVGGEMIGNRTRAKIVKNKVAPPFKEAEFDIIYGEGISKIGEIVDLGVKLDLIDKAGAWYTYGDVRVQGRDSMKEYLREHPDVSDKIEAEIRANAHKLMSPQARKAAIASGRAVEVAADDFQG